MAAPGAKLLQALQYVVIGAAIVHFLPRRFLFFLCAGAVMLVVSLVMGQEKILYHPTVPPDIKTIADNPVGYRSPKEHGIAHEDVWLEASDGVRTHAWFMPADGAAAARAAPTLVFAHENAGNIGLRMPEYKELRRELGPLNVLAYDYRGYGNSADAEICEEGLMRDARAAWAWVEKAARAGRLDGARVLLFGRSLGGAVTIQLAAELSDDARDADAAGGSAAAPPLRPAAVLVSNTFTSIEDMACVLYPWLAPLLGLGFVRRHLLRLRWRSVDHVRRVRFPIGFVRGLSDELVPAEQTLVLRDNAARAASTALHSVPDGSHNDTWLKGGADYWRFVRGFIAQHAPSGERAPTAAPPTIPPRAELEAMRVSDLRTLARARGIDIAGLPERRDIVAAVDAAR